MGDCQRARPASQFLDRADAAAIGFAQGAIDGAGLGDAHLSAANQSRYVRRIRVTIANEAGGVFARINSRLEHEAIGHGITQ